MPFSAGFHPYFLITNKNRLELDIPAQTYQNQISKETLPFTGAFDFDMDEIDFAFKGISRENVIITDHDHKLKLTFSSIYMFSTLVFWTVKTNIIIALSLGQLPVMP